MSKKVEADMPEEIRAQIKGPKKQTLEQKVDLILEWLEQIDDKLSLLVKRP